MTNSTEVIRQIEARTQTMLERARAAIIRDQASYDAAVELARAIKDLRAEAEAHHRPVIDAALRAHRAALEAFRRIDEPLKAAEQEIKRRLAAWTSEQERIRLEAERRAREEAERLRAEAIEARIERMEAAGASPEEVAAAIREAEQLPAIAPRVGATYERAAGVATQRRYRAEVFDLASLVRFAASHPAQEGLLQPNMPALNALARARGESLRIPGVRVVVEESVSIRRR